MVRGRDSAAAALFMAVGVLQFSQLGTICAAQARPLRLMPPPRQAAAETGFRSGGGRDSGTRFLRP